MVCVDVCDSGVQSGARIEPIELQPGTHEVRVGEMDEFEGHGALVTDVGARSPPARRPASPLERECFSLMTAAAVEASGVAAVVGSLRSELGIFRDQGTSRRPRQRPHLACEPTLV